MRIKTGYLKKLWESSSLLVGATIRSEGSILISGATGSGKSTLLWYLVYNLIQQMGDFLDLEICDYKAESRFLYGCPRYHCEVMDIVDTIDRFHDSFLKSRGNTGTGIHHCMVIDEYFSFISYLEGMSKINKEYKEIYQRVLMETRSILAMGRSVGYSLACVVQQANASSFSSSADRENFINKIAMGTQTSISASMIFDSADTQGAGIDYKEPVPVGCGYLAVQGEPVKKIIVPRIKNPDTMKKQIRQYLDRVAYSKPAGAD